MNGKKFKVTREKTCIFTGGREIKEENETKPGRRPSTDALPVSHFNGVSEVKASHNEQEMTT